MTHTSGPAATSEAPAVVGRSGKRNPARETIVLSVLSGVIVVLLGFTFTATNDRIDDTNDRIDDTNDRITRVEHRLERFEERVDARFAQIDAKLADLQVGVAEIDRKLTSLIAALNRTGEVEAALSGDVTGPGAPRP